MKRPTNKQATVLLALGGILALFIGMYAYQSAHEEQGCTRQYDPKDHQLLLIQC